MKKLLLLIGLSIATYFASAQKLDNLGILRKPNEELLLAFELKGNHKIVTICHDIQNRYLVYRIGTKHKVELEYPNKLGPSSWKAFKYSAYLRAGMSEYSLAFTNKGITYKVYQGYDDEYHDNHIGVLVTIGKRVDLVGMILPMLGALNNLDDYESLIPNSYNWDE